MKGKLERLFHKKQLDSPAKRRNLLASLSACAHQFTTNMQRTNRYQRSNYVDQHDEEASRFDGYRSATETSSSPSISYFHGQAYPPPSHSIVPSYPRGYAEPAPAPEDNFLNHHMYTRVPQTPSPRPPKLRRVASVSTPPFIGSVPPSTYPVQARYAPPQAVPRNITMSTIAVSHQVVGDPSLKIFRLKLPPHLLHLLDPIVLGCEAHAATLPNGWVTELYSLTKQDIALRKIPHLFDAAKPITSYIRRCIMAVFGVHSVKMDRNQPHVLKYSKEDGHAGVELHHDKCDITANLCLSRSNSYVGGGTMFPAARQVVRLDFGEFLIHPGSLVHGGMNIRAGTRHLMILFANLK